jgi:hypothetical protein
MKKKNKKVAYLLWLLGAFAGHRWYLGQKNLAILFMLTGGGFGIWWICDLFRMDKMVSHVNGEEIKKQSKEIVTLKVAFLIIHLVILSNLMSGLNSEDKAQAQESKAEQTVVKEEKKEEPVKAEPAKTEPVEVEKVEAKPVEAKPVQEPVVSQSDLEEQALYTLKISYMDIAEVTFDKENMTYTILPTDPNFKNALIQIQAGEFASEWDKVEESYKSVSVSVKETVGTGYSVTLANPFNPSNVLLLAMDGVVIYNAFE